jgi:hypothetical protein
MIGLTSIVIVLCVYKLLPFNLLMNMIIFSFLFLLMPNGFNDIFLLLFMFNAMQSNNMSRSPNSYQFIT